MQHAYYSSELLSEVVSRNRKPKTVSAARAQSNVGKGKQRRLTANARERNRMHGLNDALEQLRTLVPCSSSHHKLSKIDTLRLAKNYISVLAEMLASGNIPNGLSMAKSLSNGLSLGVASRIATTLQVSHRLVVSCFSSQDSCAASMDDQTSVHSNDDRENSFDHTNLGTGEIRYPEIQLNNCFHDYPANSPVFKTGSLYCPSQSSQLNSCLQQQWNSNPQQIREDSILYSVSNPGIYNTLALDVSNETLRFDRDLSRSRSQADLVVFQENQHDVDLDFLETASLDSGCVVQNGFELDH